MTSLPPDPTSPEPAGDASRPDEPDGAASPDDAARLDEPGGPADPDGEAQPDDAAWPEGLPDWLDDGSADADAGGAPEVPDALPPPTEAAYRARRRTWRRRRRVLGTLAFLAIIGVLVYVVAEATGLGQDDGEATRDLTTTALPTTTTLPPAGPYRVFDGLNARAGPGATFPVVGVIEIGHQVMVSCVADGTLVNGPNGQSTKWLRVPTPFGDIWLTAAYVSVGADLANPAKIAPCPA